MKAGDWVITESGRIGQITLLNFNAKGYHLVDYQDNTFARVTHEHYIKPFDPAVSDILTAVNINEEK